MAMPWFQRSEHSPTSCRQFSSPRPPSLKRPNNPVSAHTFPCSTLTPHMHLPRDHKGAMPSLLALTSLPSSALKLSCRSHRWQCQPAVAHHPLCFLAMVTGLAGLEHTTSLLLVDQKSADAIGVSASVLTIAYSVQALYTHSAITHPWGDICKVISQ